VTHTVNAATNEPASGSRAYYRRQLAFLGEGGDPLACARCGSIHQNGNLAVKRLRTKALGDDGNGIVPEAELEGQPKERLLP
jgi:hypothetical protein